MISSLDQLNAVCLHRAKELWPTLRCVPDFLPLRDITLGDVGSSFSQEIAEEIRLPVPEVVDRLLTGFSAGTNIELRSIEGFINATLSPSVENLLSFKQRKLIANSHTILVHTGASSSHWGVARLLASALTQSLIVGNPRILFSGEELCPDRNIGATFRTAMGRYLKLSKNSASAEIAEIQGEATLWSEVEGWKSFLKQRGLKRNQTLFTPYCSRKWLAVDESEKALQGSLDWDDRELKALCVVLSRELDGRSVDISAARFNEEQNLIWFIDSMRGRLQGWVAEESPERANTLLPPLERSILIRLLFLDEFNFRGGFKGSLIDLLEVVSDLLTKLNRYVNSPELRQRLGVGASEPLERLILLRAQRELIGLSGIFCG